MIVSIHQPNYIPWIGFFHKVANSDIYVVFDDVQLVRGKSFVIRTEIKTEGGGKWLTVPVLDKSKMLKINQVKINNNENWKEKHWNALKSNYSKTLFFNDFSKSFYQIFNKNWDSLVEMNVEIIKMLMKILDIKTKILFSSSLNVELTGIEKILGIIKKVGADEYFSGSGEGSKRYLENQESKFKKEGIELKFQEFQHPKYPQLFGKFIPNLSICDMLFNVGAKQTIQILLNKTEDKN